jgi:hypothetical protein
MQLKEAMRTRLPFQGNGLHFGLEIEVEARSGYDEGCVMYEFEDCTGLIEDVDVHAKEDGSLVNGVEFAFAPMTLERMREYLFPRLDNLEGKTFVAWGSSTRCGRGTHIHIGKDRFDDVWHMWRFICAFNDPASVRAFGGRELVAYASFYRMRIDTAGLIHNNQRDYMFMSDQTLELRFFRSTVSARRLDRWFSVLTAIFEDTKTKMVSLSNYIKHAD